VRSAIATDYSPRAGALTAKIATHVLVDVLGSMGMRASHGELVYRGPFEDRRGSIDTGLGVRHGVRVSLPEYERELSAFHKAFAVELEQAIYSLPLGPSSRVLDLACGDGFYTRRLAERLGPGGEVTGADIDPNYLQVARKACAAYIVAPPPSISSRPRSIACPIQPAASTSSGVRRACKASRIRWRYWRSWRLYSVQVERSEFWRTT